MELTYTTVEGVDTYAAANGRDDWLELSLTARTRAVVESTEDILLFHGVILTDSLWFEDDTDLIKAAIIQAIYIGKEQGNRDGAESLKAMSDGSYNDGVTNVGVVANRKLAPVSKLLVKQVVDEAIRFGDTHSDLLNVRLRGNRLQRNG